MADGPLNGYSALELCTSPGGAYCGKLLAMFGADVVKIELPGVGDPARGAGPFPEGLPDREKSALFLHLNTGKRSVTVDWRARTGARLALALAEYSDAVVCDLTPAEEQATGLTPETFARANPRATVTSLTAFGRSGPWKDWRWTNMTSFAAGGQHYLTGDPDREPLASGGLQAEYQAGLHAFGATLAGLYWTMRSEVGQGVEVAAMEAQAGTLEVALPDYAYRGADGLTKRRGNQQSALIGVYPAKDGHIGIHCMPKNWPQLMKAMDSEWMIDDERFRDTRARLQHGDEILARFFAWSATVTKREATRIAGETRAPISPVNSIEDLLADDHLRARAFFRDVEHPAAGRVTHPGPPARMSLTPASVAPAPLLGQHTVEVLSGTLGLSHAEITLLRQQGIV